MSDDKEKEMDEFRQAALDLGVSEEAIDFTIEVMSLPVHYAQAAFTWWDKLPHWLQAAHIVATYYQMDLAKARDELDTPENTVLLDKNKGDDNDD